LVSWRASESAEILEQLKALGATPPLDRRSFAPVEADKAALKQYWQKLAQRWWDGNDALQVLCCKCGRIAIARGEGFFSEIFGEMFCDACCELRVARDRLETMYKDKAGVTQGELRDARRLAGLEDRRR
jgi:hypothetical protein